MQDIKDKWEEWYGDMVDMYQWSEINCSGKTVLYVSGCAKYTGDQESIPAGFVQVVGCVDSDMPFSEEEKKEIAELLKGMYKVDTVSFWLA